MNQKVAEQPHLLFTPGPLTTSASVKRAMLSDYGSREPAFIDIVRNIRRSLLEIGGVSQEAGFEAVPMQGSGTFGIESTIGSVIPEDGKLLAIVNGAYGRRIVQIAERLKIAVTFLEFDETGVPDLDQIDAMLAGDDSITHVATVHCETTTGVLNPIEAMAGIVARHNRAFIVDAMSSFGGIPIDLGTNEIDFLISSSNKCLEGVPGFSFVLAKRCHLEASRGNARSVSLDLSAQWDALEGNGQFRFTPPTHAILAFNQALIELQEEGGVTGRNQRYCESYDTLVRGMEAMGFDCLVEPELRSPIITTFAEPEDPAFDFDRFYGHLASSQFIIYPGKVSQQASFRIGTIGKINSRDVSRLLQAIRETLEEMKVELAAMVN